MLRLAAPSEKKRELQRLVSEENPQPPAEDLTVVSMSASTNKVFSDRREELDF